MTPEYDRTGLGLVRQPKTVLFGPGQRVQLGAIVRGVAAEALVVTDARMAETGEFAGLMAGLREAGVEVRLFDRAQPELPRSNILEALSMIGPTGELGAVVGIGGGSCLDLAKVLSVLITNKGDVRDYFGEFKVPGPGLPVFTVPTTGGTGSEVTAIAVVFDDEADMKMGIASPHLEPLAALIDPELTLSCPPGLTAATAADTLSHLIESYTARYKNPGAVDLATRFYTGKNRITNLFATEGLRLINDALERVVADPSDLSARGDMMFAAYCAGMAINTTGTAAAHAIQAPIAAIGHASHGFGVGALLPYVMRFNLPVRIKEFAEIGRIFRLPDTGDDLALARAAILRVEALLAAAGAPLELKPLGVTPDRFDWLAAQAMKSTRLTANNPREMTEAGVRRLIERGHAGDRSWWD